MPSSIHESTINAISRSLARVIDTIGHDLLVVELQVGCNTEFKMKTNRAIPDFQISISASELDTKPELLWVAECSFTQPREQAIRKLERYIAEYPTIRAVTLVNLTECPQFRSPAIKSIACQTLSRIPAVLDYQQWTPGNRKESPMGPVVTHGHTWASLSGIDVEVWIAKPGEKLELSDHGDSCYALGSLFPQTNTQAVDGLLRRALELVRDRVFDTMEDVEAADPGNEDHAPRLAAIRGWSAPCNPVLWPLIAKAIESGVWLTSFNRYHAYHESLLGRRPADGQGPGTSPGQNRPEAM